MRYLEFPPKGRLAIQFEMRRTFRYTKAYRHAEMAFSHALIGTVEHTASYLRRKVLSRELTPENVSDILRIFSRHGMKIAEPGYILGRPVRRTGNLLDWEKGPLARQSSLHFRFALRGLDFPRLVSTKQ